MKRTPEEIERQIKIIQRGTSKIVNVEELKDKLARKDQLTVKLGCDPTRPDLHFGHLVVLRKLRQFQDLGHKIVLLIGDFTAMIGDPTGRSKTREPLTHEETKRNGETYVAQAGKVLDTNKDKLTIVHNSEWLGALSFRDVITLAAQYTVSRMLERNDFTDRFESQQPISVHEFLYPLAQAYDSVHLHADVELGGNDQEFNLLIGRDVQRGYGQEVQAILTMPLLVGLDGEQKMSKSLGNYIALTDTPHAMFSKLMKVPDSLVREYLTLLTELEVEGVMGKGVLEAHRILARTLVTQLYDEASCQSAESDYDRIASGALPDNLQTVSLQADPATPLTGVRLVVVSGLAKSNGEARRLIEGKGIKVNGELVSDPQAKFPNTGEFVVSKGKNSYVKVVIG